MTPEKANWTIMVYISADNILANFAIESLKQLKRAASRDKEIVVAAQLDASGGREVRRYLFDGVLHENSSLHNDVKPITGAQPSTKGIADSKNLTDFIDWGLKQSKSPDDHTCLILWGHGYELLVDEDQPGSAGKDGRNYLTPNNLRKALREALRLAKLPKGRLDIIGIDACAMSLIELATELQDLADYMIASQEDVPDLSFPYEEMLSRLKGLSVEQICEAIPKLYKQAYQDYFATPGSGIGERTLTSVRLNQVSGVLNPLKQLAATLNAVAFDKELGHKIFDAREKTRDFALGMFVDLYDFCSELVKVDPGDELKKACVAVSGAIDAAQAAQKLGFQIDHKPGTLAASESNPSVLENQTSDNAESRCHGLSIYFPYFTKKDRRKVQAGLQESGPKPADVHIPMQAIQAMPTKGGPLHLEKGGPLHLEKGGPLHLDKARGARIEEMEADFAALEKFQASTGWAQFIQQAWSYILATNVTKDYDLDSCYSGEQCAKNLAAMAAMEHENCGKPPDPPPPPPGKGRGASAG